MTVSIAAVVDAFHLLYTNFHDRKLRKTIPLNHWSERDMLPLIRDFLLYFGRIYLEVQVRLPKSLAGWGMVDSAIDDVAVEFAVRRPLDKKVALLPRTNSTEIKKLIMWQSRSLFVMLDFPKSSFQESELEGFRCCPSLGRGNFKLSPFNLSYHYIFGAVA